MSFFSEVKTSYYRDHNHKSSPLHWWQLTSRPGSEGTLEEQRLQLHKLAFEQFHRPGTCSICEKRLKRILDFLEIIGLLYFTDHDDDICRLHGIDLSWVNGPFLKAGLNVFEGYGGF